jgi:hypothetical protein
MLGPDIGPGHRLAVGIDAGHIVRSLGAGVRRRPFQDGIGRKSPVCRKNRGGGTENGEADPHVISLRLLRCNKANYCVTSTGETIINRTHKKKAKNRKSGQVRG